ncbi:MAG TPA: metallophosphoesterase [Methanotrichaceae archaeon]|nr:metallophosphoesterase [Methanotrichaceae archaeon]
MMLQATPVFATPVFGEPLLLVEGMERVLVAADLHLGLEYELWLGGISIPSQTEGILKHLLRSLAEVKPDRLLLLGDVKHNVPRTSWQERKEVPRFLRALAQDVRVDIVPGNHDAGLADLAPNGSRVHPSSGLVIDGVGYFHGHTWPDRKLLSAELLVAGHIHPAVRLKDPLGSSRNRRAWARVPLSPAAVERQYGLGMSAPEMVVVPAFNDLCGGLPLNEAPEDERGPILTLADMDDARIFLLDGTDLGRLRSIRSAHKGEKRLLP